MQSFENYFEEKMKNTEFKAFYETECHVCANTMGIFEKADRESISTHCLARAAGADPARLIALRDAEHCDPGLVIRLCHHLGLQAPRDCPKLDLG